MERNSYSQKPQAIHYNFHVEAEGQKRPLVLRTVHTKQVNDSGILGSFNTSQPNLFIMHLNQPKVT